MSSLRGSNWNITRIGSVSVILLALGFLGFIASNDPAQIENPLMNPIFLAAGAGLVFAASARVADFRRLETFMKPLSGFLNVVAGALFVAALMLFFSSSLQIALETFSQFQGGSLANMVRAIVMPILGYSTLLFGIFLASAGVFLIYWDRVGGRVPVGPDRGDFTFVVIIAVLTVFGVFGRAFLNNVPALSYLQGFTDFILSSTDFASVFAGILVVITYFSVRLLWESLPIREAVPRSSRDTYDSLKKPEKIVRLVLVPAVGLATLIQGFFEIPVLGFLGFLTSSGLRTLMAGITVLSIITVAALKAFKLFTKDLEKLKILLPYLMFGVFVYVSAPFLTGVVDMVMADLPEVISGAAEPVIDSVGKTQFVMILMVLSAAWAVLLKSFMDFLRLFGLVPKGVEGTTLVASGVFFSAIGFYPYSQQSLVLFTGVSLSMICWELGKRSVILGREVGRSSNTYQVELVQVLSKLIVAFLAVLAARTLLVAVRNTSLLVSSGGQGFIVMILAVIGVGLLTFSLKEFT